MSVSHFKIIVMSLLFNALGVPIAQSDDLYSEPLLYLTIPEGHNNNQIVLEHPDQGEPTLPSDFAVDSDGNVWIADDFSRKIKQFNSQGDLVNSWDGNGYKISRTNGLALTKDDSIVILVSSNEMPDKIIILDTLLQQKEVIDFTVSAHPSLFIDS